jgi:plasmid maintenance system antidote protein VapI
MFWCKAVRVKLAEADMSKNELAEKAGLANNYCSAVINGRIISKNAAMAINRVLGLPENEYLSMTDFSVELKHNLEE